MEFAESPDLNFSVTMWQGDPAMKKSAEISDILLHAEKVF